MSIMSIAAPAGIGAGVSHVGQKLVQTLGLDAASGGSASIDPGVAATGSTQASLGATGTMPEPPKPQKIILGSVLRGAFTGATLLFSVNKFVPPGTLNTILHFLPFTSGINFPIGTLVALGAGAVIGGLAGFLGGVKKSKKAVAEYAKAAAAAQGADPAATAAQGQAAPAADPNTAAPIGSPIIVGPDGQPVAINPNTNIPVAPVGTASPTVAPAAPPSARKKKVKTNPVMQPGYTSTAVGSHSTKARRKRRRLPFNSYSAPVSHVRHAGNHKVRRGDTLWDLSRAYGTSVDAIMRSNPHIKNRNLIITGDHLVIPKKRRTLSLHRQHARHTAHSGAHHVQHESKHHAPRAAAPEHRMRHAAKHAVQHDSHVKTHHAKKARHH